MNKAQKSKRNFRNSKAWKEFRHDMNTKQKGIELYSIKEGFTNTDKSITSTVTTTVFALVAQIERELKYRNY